MLADTERDGHLPAFNQMFAEFGLPVQWSEEEYGRKLKIGGGKERMRSLLTPEFVAAADLPTDTDEQLALVGRWHKRKTEIYTEMAAAGKLPARPGIAPDHEAADAGWQLAVASTPPSRPSARCWNMSSGQKRRTGSSVFAGDVVPQEARPRHLPARAGSPWPAGLGHAGDRGFRNRARRRARSGHPCLVTVNEYTRDDDFDAAALVVSSLGDPDGERTQVLANASGVPVGDWVTLETVEALVS